MSNLVQQMSGDLQLPLSTVNRIISSANYLYKTYTIPKRGGGTRTIHHPSRALKAIQRWLVTRILDGFPVHAAATAYRKGLSIKDNAKQHVNGRYLLRMDFESFFASIKATDVALYLRDKRFSEEDIKLITSIVCRQGALTIGSPSSPAVSNAICFDMDEAIYSYAAKHGITYTRYADDIVFSVAEKDVLKDVPDAIERIVRSLRYPSNLRVNAKKTRHASKRGARRVTGLILTSDGHVSVGRKLKRKVRALVHKHASLSESERASLPGYITFIESIDPDFMNSLILKYGFNLIDSIVRNK